MGEGNILAQPPLYRIEFVDNLKRLPTLLFHSPSLSSLLFGTACSSQVMIGVLVMSAELVSTPVEIPTGNHNHATFNSNLNTLEIKTIQYHSLGSSSPCGNHVLCQKPIPILRDSDKSARLCLSRVYAN